MYLQLNTSIRQTMLHGPGIAFGFKDGILLALDGLHLERPALPLALELCKRAGKRLDILLLNPPQPSTLMLGKFLLNLEREGIDYRLSTGEGDLADQLPSYLRRFKYIKCVLLDHHEKLDMKLRLTLDTLRRQEYKILALLDRHSDPLVGQA